MPHKPKPTTTPALIDKAKSCTSAKEVIQTLFSITRTPNGLESKEAKKIFLKEGIPWPSMRGRKRKGKVVLQKPIRASEVAKTIADSILIPRFPVAFCPACGTGIYECVDRPCEGCKRDLTIEIHTRTIYFITAK